ncbi:tRNA uridine-5-carboxymethylaminomethyl(34) synthesis GTPase MnmE [Corallincola holothuriorum]|uniref:tRNA modification GTPase MnmE n=1 Tax=Corallincola holothuriorum TaxID=2282215 RepID=A0A368N4Q4_9GAMM|nr:tRNA uridine-5-carboxymethylaminomethyl(34) synthesis GTPase MnmE [Corallincola holothuriorum]RCU45532.1 tRNA uridine-5-carboxymethylaminomethyl(34) synthesis GTPase MnmE [Corallincola holothuriorum]
MPSHIDTIVAQATPPGRGGVSIIRVSGPDAELVAETVLGKVPAPRVAEYLPFKDHKAQILDQGIALLFKAPNSFTGENVLELQGHGGPVVVDMLLKAICRIPGIRIANPGEFSERAFLNDKLDLTQAEAIADLIEANSEAAAKSALHSLQGVFSQQVHALVEQLTHLRIYVEAAIDFPDEEVDFLSDGKISGDLSAIEQQLAEVQSQAKQGSLIREGMRVVLAGKPNAGKSSLLNALAGKEAAIVTEIAGTTRDVLREHIHIDGMPLHIIDTAGLRESPDKVEQIGIARAWEEINQADRVLFLVDASETKETDPHKIWPELVDKLPNDVPLTLVRNKLDVADIQAKPTAEGRYPIIQISAKTGSGIDELKVHLKAIMGYQGQGGEGQFTARRRHTEALKQAEQHLIQGREQLDIYCAGELLAEELRLAQQALAEITGEFSSDDLLGKIFSSFCIGK